MLLFFQKALTQDDIFSELLNCHTDKGAIQSVHLSTYLIFFAVLCSFFIFYGIMYTQCAVGLAFTLFLVQLQIIAFKFLPRNIRRNRFVFMSSYLVLAVISCILICCLPQPIVSVLFFHSYTPYILLDSIPDKILSLFVLLIYSFIFISSFYLLDLISKLLVLYYGSFFCMVISKIFIFDKFDIKVSIDTKNRFNFQKDTKLVIVFLLFLVLNFMIQSYMHGRDFLWR